MNNANYLQAKSIANVCMPIIHKGWQGEFFYYDEKDNYLKQAKFLKLEYYLVSHNNRLNSEYVLTFATAEKDGILRRRITNILIHPILSHFYKSDADWRRGVNITYQDYTHLVSQENLSDVLKVIMPFKAKIEYTPYVDIDVFRYQSKKNNIEKVYIEIPTHYIYTYESGMCAGSEISCPPNTYATKDECQQNMEVNVYRFDDVKPECNTDEKEFYVIAINGIAKAVKKETYNSIKTLLKD